jgi:hypothetical protein
MISGLPELLVNIDGIQKFNCLAKLSRPCLFRVIHDRVEPIASPAMSAMPSNAEVNSEQ